MTRPKIDANTTDLDFRLQESKKSLELLRKRYATLGGEVHSQYDLVKALAEEAFRRKFVEAQENNDKATLYSLLLTHDEEFEAGYKMRQKYFLDHLHGINGSGYYECEDGSLQHPLRISLTEGDLTNESNLAQYQAVKEMLPYVKTKKHQTLKGAKFIGVMEKTCSQYGVYGVYVTQDGSVTLGFTRYSRETFKHIGKDLEEAFKYLSANVWYSGHTEEDTEDDD